MKATIAALLLALAVPSAFAVDVPIYPGAKINAMLTQAQHDNNPANEAYTTQDSWEKVYAYYKGLGTGIENLKMKTMNDQYKFAEFGFSGKQFKVGIGWVPKGGLGTMITFAKLDN
jgi:hypothetical protein